jgi:hypothetical protein
MTDVQALRHRLRNAGYSPIPLYGKEPPRYGKNNSKKGLSQWEELHDVTAEQIDLWAITWPDAINTGVLTFRMPTLDIDVLNEEAVRAIEDYVRKHYEENGYVLPRIGLPPKRAIPFRTEEPFKKITVNLIAADGSEGQKIEFLADGQQVVVAGIHPDTKKPYHWPRGQPGQIKLEDLPYIREAEARALVEAIVEILVRDFGYKRARSRPGKRADGQGNGQSDWAYLYNNIREGRELHDSIRDLAAKVIACGTHPGAAVNQLRAMMEDSKAPRDERWRARVREIPDAVDSAVEKYGKKPEPAESAPPKASEGKQSTLESVVAAFNKWLLLPNPWLIYVTLGAVVANYLPGPPVWLGLLAPPSSAKTEILMSLSQLEKVELLTTASPAALLSGTPKKQVAKGAKGGLLRQLGAFGILVMKDFTSVLGLHKDELSAMLDALREIYDGKWVRHLGTEGGTTYKWEGKLGLLFGCTEAYDTHYAVIGALGDRFLIYRLPGSDSDQFETALRHSGDQFKQMREELAAATASLFARLPDPMPTPLPLTPDESLRLKQVVILACHLRGGVQRDRYSREIEAVFGAEGPGRLALSLERLLAGLSIIGIDREVALQIVEKVALDSVPPIRRKAYEALGPLARKTRDVATELGLPTITTRRALEDITAQGLAVRKRVRTEEGKDGRDDTWTKVELTVRAASDRSSPQSGEG